MKEIKNSFIQKNSTLNTLDSSYKVPKQYIDCRKLLQKNIQQNGKYKKRQMPTKQKNLKFKRKFFLDQSIQHFKEYPSPNKYTQNYSTFKRYKSLNTFITKSKQTQKLGKRPTWIQDIQKHQAKYKQSSVGKYNIMTLSDFNIKKKSISLQNLSKGGTKYNYLDDISYLASKIPGPGSHNPHKQIVKLKVNMITIKPVKQQKQADHKKLNSSNVSCCKYNPIMDKTFDKISKQPKKECTLMRKPIIDKRVGIKSLCKMPSPASYQTINKWGTQTFNRQKLIGKFKLFDKTTRSFPILRIYN